MSKANFPAHGGLELSVEGQILIIKEYGPANVEMVEHYQRSVGSFREQIMHAPWASLVLLRGTPLVTAEAKATLVNTIKQAKLLHLSATAVVFVDIEFREIIQQFWQDIYHEAKVNYQFFEAEADARLWLSEILSHAAMRFEA